MRASMMVENVRKLFVILKAQDLSDYVNQYGLVVIHLFNHFLYFHIMGWNTLISNRYAGFHRDQQSETIHRGLQSKTITYRGLQSETIS